LQEECTATSDHHTPPPNDVTITDGLHCHIVVVCSKTVLTLLFLHVGNRMSLSTSRRYGRSTSVYARLWFAGLEVNDPMALRRRPRYDDPPVSDDPPVTGVIF
jgi:hypothetical protein